MKRIKNYQSFLESFESESQSEVPIEFPNPIKVQGKIYKNTEELEKDHHISSMTNFGDEITINGKELDKWVESMNDGGEGQNEEDYGMETEGGCDECD